MSELFFEAVPRGIYPAIDERMAENLTYMASLSIKKLKKYLMVLEEDFLDSPQKKLFRKFLVTIIDIKKGKKDTSSLLEFKQFVPMAAS